MPHDDGAGGLLIVRAPESQPSHSQPVVSHTADTQPPRFASQSAPDVAGPSKPAAKKFKADSQPSRPTSKPKLSARDRVAYSGEYNDSDVEKDVRAMEDEADNLRRKSRANMTISAALVAGDANIQFAPRAEDTTNTSRSKGKAKATDMTPAMVARENMQLERNKQFRQGSVDIGVNGRGRTMDTTASRGHRRKSSVGGRGKRTSTVFETTGVISALLAPSKPIAS